MSVGEVCNREVIIGYKTENMTSVAKLMRNAHVGSVVVARRENGITQPLGIITDRDLVLEVLAQEVDPNTIYAEDVMSPTLHSVYESDSTWDAISLMRSEGVRRIPVLDDAGSLVGILALDDVVELLAEELSSLASLVGREQRKESISRDLVD